MFLRLPNVIVQLANVVVSLADDLVCPTFVFVCPSFGHGSLANVFIRPPDVIFSPPDDDFLPDEYVSEPDDDDFPAHEYVSEPAEHVSEAEEHVREPDDDVFGTVEYVREPEGHVSQPEDYVHEADLQGRIWPLHVRKINGIGPKAGEKLAALGIQTIGELAAADRQLLIGRFGKASGAWMIDAAWGRDDSPLVTESEPVSMSRETTFARDLHAVRDKAELGAIFTRLCAQVADDLQRKGYVAKTIGIKLRYDDFRIATRDLTVQAYTDDARTVRKIAGQCLKRVPLEQRLRLLGVRATSLVKAGELPIFEKNKPCAHAVRAHGATESIAIDTLF